MGTACLSNVLSCEPNMWNVQPDQSSRYFMGVSLQALCFFSSSVNVLVSYHVACSPKVSRYLRKEWKASLQKILMTHTYKQNPSNPKLKTPV